MTDDWLPCERKDTDDTKSTSHFQTTAAFFSSLLPGAGGRRLLAAGSAGDGFCEERVCMLEEELAPPDKKFQDLSLGPLKVQNFLLLCSPIRPNSNFATPKLLQILGNNPLTKSRCLG